ncbi:MAG: FAD-dependent monooxygenase [Geminicoccaceae bacterium]
MRQRRVGVVGGSIGGLAAAWELRRLGADVTVWERSAHRLEGRGAGIMLDPVLHAYLAQAGLVLHGLPVTRRLAIGRNERILWTQAVGPTATSWAQIHAALRRALPDDAVQAGCPVEAVRVAGDRAGLRAGGADVDGLDLLVGADGVESTVRRCLLPGTEPDYVGYVIVRGLVEEAAVPAAAATALQRLRDGAILYYLAPQSHVIAYLVPGPDEGAACTAPGRRLVNWGWYVNLDAAALPAFLTDKDGQRHHLSLPPGALPEAQRRRLEAQAAGLFAGSFPALLAATERPFVQAITSCIAPRMALGPACLVGDAAHLIRPHAGSGAIAALQDARALREALDGADDVAAGLQRWEAVRLPACRALHDLADRLGIAHQVEANDWERFSEADFEAWWAAAMQGGRLYFDKGKRRE